MDAQDTKKNRSVVHVTPPSGGIFAPRERESLRDKQKFTSIIEELVKLTGSTYFKTTIYGEATPQQIADVLVEIIRNPRGEDTLHVESLASSGLVLLGRDAVPAIIRVLPHVTLLTGESWIYVTIREMGVVAREAGPTLFRLAKEVHFSELHSSVQALRAVLGLNDLEINFKKYNTYKDLISYVDRMKERPKRPTTLPPTPPPKLGAERSGRFDLFPATVPKDAGYDVLANRLEEEIRTVRQQVAIRLLPALKDEMRRRDHGTYDQKVELVAWVKGELQRFDMAFKHPKTGEAATLKPSPGNHPDVGSFELGGKDTEGRRTTFTTPDLDTLLDKLELMDAPPRREALAEWQATVGRDRRGAKRG